MTCNNLHINRRGGIGLKNQRNVLLIFFIGLLLLFGFVPLSTDAGIDAFIVYPSGDMTGLEDVSNIQAAIDAAGSETVKLGIGDFYIANTIVTSGFEGILKGTSSKTMIHAVGSIDTMFSFNMPSGSNLKVEKLSFTTELDSVTALEIITDGDFWVTHCEFYNVEIGVSTYDNFDSEIIVKHNEFYDVGQAIYLGGPFGSCKIVISHNIIDVARHGVEVYDLDDSSVIICHNKIVGIYDSAENYQTGAAIMVAQTTLFGASGLVDIMFNEIQGYTRWDWGYDLVNVLDYGPLSTGEFGNLESTIAFNSIELDESLWGGIGVHGGFSDTLIAFNDVSGSGDAAIYVAFWSLWGLESQTGLKVILNDVSDFSAIPVPGWIDPTAPIWLGPGVYDSLVLAKGDSSTVLDVSGNNTVVFIGQFKL